MSGGFLRFFYRVWSVDRTSVGGRYILRLVGSEKTPELATMKFFCTGKFRFLYLLALVQSGLYGAVVRSF